MKTRLLIVDDDPLLGQTLAWWLTQQDTFEVIGPIQDEQVAVDVLSRLEPDAVLMSACHGSAKTADAVRGIVAQVPGVRILILSTDVGSRSVRQALEAGAKGYLSRRCTPEGLLTAIQFLVEHGVYLCPVANAAVVNDYSTQGEASASPLPLTAREQQVIQLLAEGRNTKAIALQLSLSPKTVDWHKSQLMKKLGIDSLAGLVRYAIQEGLSPLAMTSLEATT